ncbi:MAG: DUF1826 domain-containing protein [Candidatus Sericytochromatia bacterium]|nr:DUF1826 domain-containing protein [Candidatus Sericytochromatia bacterium]
MPFVTPWPSATHSAAEAARQLKARPGEAWLRQPPEERQRTLAEALSPYHHAAAWEVEYCVAARATHWAAEPLEQALGHALVGLDPADNQRLREVLCDEALDQAAWLYQLACEFGIACETLRLRWSAIAHQPCWKFHRDTMPLRLVTTYRGPTTQWTSDEALLGLTTAGPEHTLNAAAPGAALVMPGKLAPAPLAPGVIHRSPPLETSDARLLLVVDMMATVP